MRRFQSKARVIPWRTEWRRSQWRPRKGWPLALTRAPSALGACAVIVCAIGSTSCARSSEPTSNAALRDQTDAGVSPPSTHPVAAPSASGDARVEDATSSDVSRGLHDPTYIKASNPGAGASFGVAVALSSDGHTLAVAASFEAGSHAGVGAAQDDDTATRAGAVYVFTSRHSAWGQQAYIKPSNVSPEARFGSALAMSADGNVLVVGAPGDAGGANGVYGDPSAALVPGSGAVYVFERQGDTWLERAYLKAPNLAKDDAFGISIALSADGNTLAVGAELDDSLTSGVDAGAVYLFSRSDGTWQQDSYLKAANAQDGDKFGGAVALSADGLVLAVGAYGEDGGATGVNGDPNDNTNDRLGAAYLFTKDEEWVQQAYIKPASNNGAGRDGFGCSVSLSADGTVLAVGAAGEASAATGINGDALDTTAPYAGAAYLFEGSGSEWEQTAYIKASNTNEGDEFGFRVVLSADGTRLFVGAALEDSASPSVHAAQADSSTDSGAVYVFDVNGATVEQRAFVKAAPSATSDRFGWALALSSDADRLVVGAIGEAGSAAGIIGTAGMNVAPSDRTLPGAGAVYVFDGLSFALSQ